MIERKNVWENISDEEVKKLNSYCDSYMNFLSVAKTERLAYEEVRKMALENGFVDLEDKLKEGKISRGDKIFVNNKNKACALFVIGENLGEGMNIVGSHIDSPRLDIKANPMIEDGNLSYFKTHYYGGVKKYQWVNIPLALHGVLFDKQGKKINISIGEKEDEPVFYINDLLIHLSKDQMEKNAKEVITGEQLSIVIGHSSRGQKKEEKDLVTKNILKILKDKYGIDEEDFQRAEIEAVPAGRAREVGFDKSLIAGHGHDDRVCSYANVKALMEIENPRRTAVSLVVDKEEIGSVGNTGMTSKFFENAVAEILNAQGDYSDLKLRRAMANSKVLSADVNTAYDPMFKEVVEKNNVAYVGCGVGISKYTGARGKSGSNDANAEFLAEVLNKFDEKNIIWQVGELGKVDQGGGGTIAYILAEYGAEVLDCGPGMLSMHAPIELISKADAYETYKAYRAFFE